jgi:hypothetical protein
MFDTVSDGLQPQPWQHSTLGLHITPIFQNDGPHLHRYNSVRVHPYAHPQHMKVLNHYIHIQYGCGMQSVVVYSIKHNTTTSFGLRLAPIFQNLAPTWYRYNCVTVHPYAHPQHMKVLEHFVYFQYGCGMQLVVFYSLNHDTMTSCGLCFTPIFQKCWPPPAQVQPSKGAPICPSRAYYGTQEPYIDADMLHDQSPTQTYTIPQCKSHYRVSH